MDLSLSKYVLLIFFIIIKICQSQKAEKYTAQNPCISKQTCRDCIQTKSCAWCYERNFDDRPRCFQPSMTSISGGCDEAYTYNPDNLVSKIDERALSRAQGGMAASGSFQSSGSSSSGDYGSGSFAGGAAAGAGEIVQISPQRVNLQLRINEVHKLSVSYSQAEDYPVDLYYLMDLSKSMENDKEKLSALGDLLSNTMRNITSNFRLGFGSFVDKVVMPYVSTVPKNLESPCDGCAAPYGYINEMPLSTNTAHFTEAVRNANVSGNLDAPEGGFDAIMQAVVCRQEIGWREKARRLLVFSTDAGFHYAGDGKLGGIVQPNDGFCHMENGKYTYSDKQDYPSISQINLKVKENHINVIFAVTAEQISVYDQLKAHIEGASSGVLTADSSNVVDLVKDQYNKISSAVEMKDNSTSAVQINYFSSCLGGGVPTQTNKCDGLKVGDVVQFEAEIMVTECPEDPREWKQTFHIYPVGINESLVVELEMLCDCPCERPGHPMYDEHSPVCNDAGVYACGVCMCTPGHFGRNCECSAAGGTGSVEPPNACRPHNMTMGPECSGRGHCFCGVCECEKLPDPNEQITGPFCECDNFSCDRNKNMLCSGEDHGTCVCGQCVCKPGWTGPACDCKSSVDTCIFPGSTEVCSGHGTCECGVCACNVGNGDEGHYSGRYCESCTTCPGRCDQYKDCVMCMYYKQGKLTEEECNKTCTSEILEIIPVKVVKQDEAKGEHLCTYYDDNDCLFSYVYYFNETNKVYINTLEKPDCPPPVFILGIVLGVIAAIVLVGLALLMLWKMVTTIHDRREFARFEKERMMAKWDTGENPIYKQATSTFKNPTYAGK